MQRLRITFSKLGAARYAGHLDLHRAWERALRRAGAPLAYSEGFHPQPKIQLASALPLGLTSEAEVADIWLVEEVEPETLLRNLQRVLPPGMEVHSVERVVGKQKSLQSQLRAAEFVAHLFCNIPATDLKLQERVDELLARSAITRERRNKMYDLRPLIEGLRVEDSKGGGEQTLFMRLSAREGATGRPEEVLAALGLEACTARIHRTRLIFVDNST